MSDRSAVRLPDGRVLTAELWTNGEPNRRLRFGDPCECGCDRANGITYLTGSDSQGNGFTLWLRTPEEISTVWTILNSGRHGLPIPALPDARE